MTQSNLGTIVASSTSGNQLATDLTNFEDALLTQHSGSSRPSYAATGTIWTDSSSSNYIYYAYDGSDDIPIFQFDATNNVARVAMDNDGDTYIVADADDRLRFVAGGAEAFRIDGVASGVNYVSITNATTGNAASIDAAGTDTNIDLDLDGKGTGLPNMASGFKAGGVAAYAFGTEQILTSGSTYTTPSNCRMIEVVCIGAGGGGGGAGSTTSGSGAAGGGGSGGGMVEDRIVSPAASYTISVGSGGSGGVGAATGSDGGDTTFTDGGSISLTAGGGTGGGGAASTSGGSRVLGRAGGTASGGDINTPGNASSNAGVISGDVIVTGNGGGSPRGGGATTLTSLGNGTAGSAYGAGGSGAAGQDVSGAFTGGDGADGVIIVREYY